jgi:hydroxymethylbilane synthase
VDTRIRKLQSGEFDALILAAAGLNRLGLTDHVTKIIPPDQILPAIGQGALGLEVRADDDEVRDLVKHVNHEPTEVTVKAERAFLQRLEGGCQVPMAAFAQQRGETLHVQGMVGELDGSKILRHEMGGEAKRAEEIGIDLAEKVLEAGADEILKSIYEGIARH